MIRITRRTILTLVISGIKLQYTRNNRTLPCTIFLYDLPITFISGIYAVFIRAEKPPSKSAEKSGGLSIFITGWLLYLVFFRKNETD